RAQGPKHRRLGRRRHRDHRAPRQAACADAGVDHLHTEERGRRAPLRGHREAATRAMEQRRMKATEFYDVLETRLPAVREAALMAALQRRVAHAKASTAAFAE